jgi:hypothetical protein
LAACGGVSDTEIIEALRDAEGQTTGLSSKVGEIWTAQRSTTNRVDVPYKYENGKATACAEAQAQTSETNCGAPAATLVLTTADEWATVVGRSDTAFSDAPGIVISESITTTTEKFTLWAANGTTTTLAGATREGVSNVYTLFVHNGFVARIDDAGGSDADPGAGTALYPANPVRDRIYTDDNGYSWEITGGSRVALENRTLSAAAATVATNKAYWSLERIQKECFKRTPAGGSTYNVTRVGACAGTLMIQYEKRADIGLDLVLRATSRSVTVELIDWGVRASDGTLQTNGIPNADGGEIVFLYETDEYAEDYALKTLTF